MCFSLGCQEVLEKGELWAYPPFSTVPYRFMSASQEHGIPQCVGWVHPAAPEVGRVLPRARHFHGEAFRWLLWEGVRVSMPTSVLV